MTTLINTENIRSKLKVRGTPYWHHILPGQFIGFRKTQSKSSWLARWRGPDGKQQYKKLPTVSALPEADQFKAADKAAREWFNRIESGGDTVTAHYTVGMAADYYLDDLKARKGPRAARDAQYRIKAYILSKFEHVYVDELKTVQLKRWLNGLVPKNDDPEISRKARNSANRNLTVFKALLNCLFEAGEVEDDKAWRRVKGFPKTDGARKVFFSPAQIERMLEHAPSSLRTLITGLLLTGCRPGKEIEHIKREQFDEHNGTLDIRISKTGPRAMLLSKEAKDFFTQLSRGKLPQAYLFTSDSGNPWYENQASREFVMLRKKANLDHDAVMYSIRHTYISNTLEHGASPKLIADNVGTSLLMLQRNYWKAINSKRQGQLDVVSMLPDWEKQA